MAHEGDPDYIQPKEEPIISGSGNKLAFTDFPGGPISQKIDLSEAAFAKFASNEMDEVLSGLLKEKGSQYSGHADNALVNFLDGSASVGMSPANYLMALATKHWHSIGLWSSGKSDMSIDLVCERAKDIIVYMLLLIWMLRTHQNKGR